MNETPQQYLENRRDTVLDELLEFLRIPSVSTDPAHSGDVRHAAEWVAQRLRTAGMQGVEIIETPGHPAVYAEWLGAPGRPTILVYGHYDVQPPDPLYLWKSDPFSPDIRDGRIYARGVSDDKGPMFISLKVAEAFLQTEGALPVNIKMLFEGEEEIGSPNLNGLIEEQRERLAADYALSADGAMWRIDVPSISTGSRGLVSLEVEVQGAAKDLHSGRHGGAVQNPVHALATLLAGLHRPNGSVAVEGFYDEVRPLTETERVHMSALPFSDEAYRQEVGAPELFGEEGYSTLERLGARPTLEVNSIWGGYQGEGSKTVVPSLAHAKITCRLVPDQSPERILELVERHLLKNVPPGVTVRVRRHPGSAAAYRISPEHPGLQVASRVLKNLYGREPAAVLVGGTLPVSEIFQRVLGIGTVFFSFSTADEDFHAPNEFFRVQRLWDGLAAWLDFWQLAGEHVPAPAK